MDKGDFIYLDGSGVGVVVGTPADDPKCPEEHLVIWFGKSDVKALVIHTVPTEYCLLMPKPDQYIPPGEADEVRDQGQARQDRCPEDRA